LRRVRAAMSPESRRLLIFMEGKERIIEEFTELLSVKGLR
jgi:hypothetical protein